MLVRFKQNLHDIKFYLIVCTMNSWNKTMHCDYKFTTSWNALIYRERKFRNCYKPKEKGYT